MPLLKLETNVALSEDCRKTLLPALSKSVAEIIGKPEQYVMVTAGLADLLMSGSSEEAAFVDLRSIGGLSGDVNRKLSQKYLQTLARFTRHSTQPDLPQLHRRRSPQLGLEREHLRLTRVDCA